MRTHTKRRRHTRAGAQHLWGFDNGHLASVVPDVEQVHLWQLTVLDGNGGPTFRRPTPADVIGCLRPINVRRILREIEALHPSRPRGHAAIIGVP